MVYHVIIALNNTGDRRVGDVISLLEKKGLKLVDYQKKVTSPKVREFPDIRQIALQYQLNEMEAMVFYRQKFTPEVLKKKISHFYGNHVELFFENDGNSIDPNELWESIVEKVFHGGRKLPIMFITTSSGEDGINISFIPNSFDPDGSCYLPSRTLMPLGQ